MLDNQLTDPTLWKKQCFVNGQWVDADNGATLTVTDPASGEQLGTVPKLGAAETQRAIAAAALSLIHI